MKSRTTLFLALVGILLCNNQAQAQTPVEDEVQLRQWIKTIASDEFAGSP